MLDALVGGLSTSLLVQGAMLFYVSGFLFRDQVILRLLVLSGTALYIAYYYLHPTEPLWDAIFASVAIGVANVIGLAGLLYEKVPLLIGADRPIFEAIERIHPNAVSPGVFRALMRSATIQNVGEPTLLTRTGQRPDALILVVSGPVRLEKAGRRIALELPCFIGEISFLTGSAASADAWALPGAMVVRWRTDRLHKRLIADARLDQSVRALLSYDMAAKVRAAELPDPV